MFDTKFYKNRWRPLNFRRIWFFFIVTSNYKNSMYPRSFLCEEAKIKQRTPLKKELCEIGEEAIWASRFTSFSFISQAVTSTKTTTEFFSSKNNQEPVSCLESTIPHKMYIHFHIQNQLVSTIQASSSYKLLKQKKKIVASSSISI